MRNSVRLRARSCPCGMREFIGPYKARCESKSEAPFGSTLMSAGPELKDEKPIIYIYERKYGSQVLKKGSAKADQLVFVESMLFTNLVLGT